jgi:hypothetical protein
VNFANIASTCLGGLFEKSAIEEYIFQHSQDPLNGEQLSEDDLIEVQSMPFGEHRKLNYS